MILKLKFRNIDIHNHYNKMDFYDEIAYLNPSRALAQKFLFENRTKRINEIFCSGKKPFCYRPKATNNLLLASNDVS